MADLIDSFRTGVDFFTVCLQCPAGKRLTHTITTTFLILLPFQITGINNKDYGYMYVLLSPKALLLRKTNTVYFRV